MKVKSGYFEKLPIDWGVDMRKVRERHKNNKRSIFVLDLKDKRNKGGEK